MNQITLSTGEFLPLEMHKVRIVQNLTLETAKERQTHLQEAGNNMFLLNNRDVFLDMLTDSGVNAMSDRQQAAMMQADDSYAGSETFFRLKKSLVDLFGKKEFLPAHQGRACENILSIAFQKPGQIVAMNFHFTTTKAHITDKGGQVVELPTEEAMKITSDCPFKGNMDVDALDALIEKEGAEKIAFVRMEAGTNLIGGQPFSLENLQQVGKVCRKHQVILLMDASLLSDNLHFIKEREASCKSMTIQEIAHKMAEECDIIYFSGRKLGCARGGGIVTSDRKLFEAMRPLIPMYEGFLTYGGMSVREMEAMAVGIEETMNEEVISQGPQFIQFMTEKLIERKVPVVTPAGGLGCHLDAKAFLPHVPQNQYPSAALSSAIYLISGVRGMERGTMSEQREADGTEPMAKVELVRLALPRRVFTMSQILYAVDRIGWLFEHRDLIGGMEWEEEPEVLRFFYGRLKQKGDWQEKLLAAFQDEMGER